MEDALKLLLIVPSALDSHGYPVKLKKLFLPSITMPMLAAVSPDYVNSRIIYETIEDIPYEETWDLVGITGMGSGSVRAWQIADAFRERGVKTVIGGIGPSLFDPEITLMHADVIVIGEAENIWPQLLEDFRHGILKRIYHQEKLSELGQLPTPRYDLMNLRKMGFMRSAQATRGCPYACTFCSVTAFYGCDYRKRPVDKVIHDIRAIKKTGSRYVVFIDDNIFFDHDYNRELWEALIPEKIIWISSSTLQIVKYPDLMELAYKSGCRMLSVGLESLDQENLKNVQKNWNHPAEYRKAIEILRGHGIMVSASIMMGMDNDTPDTFRKVFDFVMESCIPVPRIMILTPIPGTPLYGALEKENRIIEQDFSKYSGGNVVFQPKNMDPDELQERYWKLLTDLFNVKNIFRRMSRNIPGQNPGIVAGLYVTNFNYRKHIRNHVVPGIT
jgi:radical SAM superfamily enzyme YgiQ (UPF0313 family)